MVSRQIGNGKIERFPDLLEDLWIVALPEVQDSVQDEGIHVKDVVVAQKLAAILIEPIQLLLFLCKLPFPPQTDAKPGPGGYGSGAAGGIPDRKSSITRR